MKNWQEIIHHTTFRYIDSTKETTFHHKKNDAFTSFAIDDALATSISNGESPPAMRLWVHPKTVVLGIPDGRIPYLEDGVQHISSAGYHSMIRNSGGLAVVLDEGVLNISLILSDMKHLSIHDCYEAMVQFIEYMLRDLTNDIKAYEIVGSYCPGDYDLSIDGKKFAGISQRRIKDSAAIQIYLDVNGDSHARAQLVRGFYDVGIKGEETKFTYPTVDPQVMDSLSNLLGHKLTVVDMKNRAKQALAHFATELVTPPFSDREYETFEKRYTQLLKRNERIAQLRVE